MSLQIANKLRAARTEIRGLRHALEIAERDAGALAAAVGHYIDRGCNDEEELREALSAWAQREPPKPLSSEFPSER